MSSTEEMASRAVLVVLLAATCLVAGGCTHVQSDAPLGSLPLGLERPDLFDGYWATEGKVLLLTMQDVDQGILRVTSVARAPNLDEMNSTVALLRKAPQGYIVNEADPEAPGRYSWALIERLGPDRLVIWVTADREWAFMNDIKKGLFSGTLLERTHYSGGLLHTLEAGFREVHLVLHEVNEEQVVRILEQRGRLFLSEPIVLRRITIQP